MPASILAFLLSASFLPVFLLGWIAGNLTRSRTVVRYCRAACALTVLIAGCAGLRGCGAVGYMNDPREVFSREFAAPPPASFHGKHALRYSLAGDRERATYVNLIFTLGSNDAAVLVSSGGFKPVSRSTLFAEEARVLRRRAPLFCPEGTRFFESDPFVTDGEAGAVAFLCVDDSTNQLTFRLVSPLSAKGGNVP